MINFSNKLKDVIQAKVPAIYIPSSEWLRFRGIVAKLSKDLNKKLFYYNDVFKLKQFNFENKSFDNALECQMCIEVFDNSEDNSIYVFEEIHRRLDDIDILNAFKFNIRELKRKNISIIFFSSIMNIPKELEKEVSILDFPLPAESDFEKLFKKLAKDFNISSNIGDSVLKSLLGLTIDEAENALSTAIVQRGKVSEEEIEILVSQKEQIIKKSGHLEYFHPKENLNSIGGLDNLKDWLKTRKKAFTNNAKRFSLKTPKGIMLLGVPGTGKSLSAKAVSNSWRMPLLRLDFGKVYGSLVGESESNIREAIKIAESLSPCILWIDEIEKGLSGSGGEGDNGTSTRVFGTFLTWMQEKDKEVFVVATANDVSKLPPEFLRKGRFDEIFFVDLPSKEERIDIFSIHLKNVNQNPSSLNLNLLAEHTKGFSGAEIEEIINEGLFNIFDVNSPNKPELSTNELLKVIKDFYPLSRTMEERIFKLRNWAKSRTKLASKYENEKIDSQDKIPKLKQEILDDPFMEI